MIKQGVGIRAWRKPIIKVMLTKVMTRLEQPTPALPLALFRISFGLLMLVSNVRFMLRGWVSEFYVAPQMHFRYLGFGWVRPLPAWGMYAVFGLLCLLSVGIALGLAYRVSIISFFGLFSYVELLDTTYYLNHYYFICSLSFLLSFLPVQRALSLDVYLKRVKPTRYLPIWMLTALRLQLALVYLFAGVAKLNPDWLWHAQPLQIWLRTNTELPLIGNLFDYTWVAFAMSWGGMLYDLSIPFLLLWSRTRPLAYLAVIGFHVLTALLFPIGMFPWIMIVATLVFFSAEDVKGVARALHIPQLSKQMTASPTRKTRSSTTTLNRGRYAVLLLFFMFQVMMPLRHLAYPGNVLWSEEGYRFSWRVMLAEKTGFAMFTVVEHDTDKRWSVFPSDYLMPQQAKQMAFQADMIWQFAQFLEAEFNARGHDNISIYAEVHVSMNGRSSQLYIDPEVDLLQVEHTLRPKEWILPLLADGI
ncbi:MAG: HTTM domain-containing protein [Deinococcota bacterium]